jgi:hypothetical protein
VNILDQHPGFELVGPLGDRVIELREVGLENASEHRRAVIVRVPTLVVGEWWSDTSGAVWRNDGYVGGDDGSRRPCDRSEWARDIKGLVRRLLSVTITCEWPDPESHALCVAIGMGLRWVRGDGFDLSIKRLEEWIDKCWVADIDLVSVMNEAEVGLHVSDRIQSDILVSYGFEHPGLEWTCTLAGEGDE